MPSRRGRIDDEAVAALLSRAAREVERTELPSCQVALAHDGQLVAEATFGAEPEIRYVAFSCTKAITSAATWLLVDSGDLDLEHPVGDWVPTLRSPGWDEVTIEHLLTHTAGFPEARMEIADWGDPESRLATFEGWELEWRPGTRYTYHSSSASWVLAHLIETSSGRDFRDFVARELLAPLDLGGVTLGSTTASVEALEAAALAAVGQPADPDTAAAIGLDIAAIGSDQESLLAHNDPAMRAVGQPAGGAICRAADLALFYQALMIDPSQLWSPEILAAGTTEIRCDLPDPMTGLAANRSLGLVVAGDDSNAMMRGFGRSVSGSAFGHMGAGGQVAWADPGSGLSFAYLTNGLDRDPVRMGARSDAVSTLAGRCAGAA